jgi:hypothetical protein
MRKRYDVLYNERCAEVSLENKENLRTAEATVKTDLNTAKSRVNGNRVWFGGSDYDKAEELYSKAVRNEALRDSARELQPASENSLGESLKELKAAQDATLVYIERKEKEIKSGKTLDYKGEERLKQMRNAYDALGKRIDLTYSQLETMNASEKADFEVKSANMLKEKRAAIPNKAGFDKVMAITAEDDVKNLIRLGKKSKLSANDMDTIRLVAASMMLHDKFESGELGKPNPPSVQGYYKMANAVGNSPEFKAVFGNNKLTPAFAKNLLTKPETLKAIGNKFMENAKKTNMAAKNKEIVINKNRNVQAEAPKM